MISSSLRVNVRQPLISPEVRKERSCQSFSASHMGPRTDCPFHRPAFIRPSVRTDYWEGEGILVVTLTVERNQESHPLLTGFLKKKITHFGLLSTNNSGG